MLTLLSPKLTNHQFKLQLVGLLELLAEEEVALESKIGFQKLTLQVPKLFIKEKNGNLLGEMEKMLLLKIFGDIGLSFPNVQLIYAIVLQQSGQALKITTQEIVPLREISLGPLLTRMPLQIQIQDGKTLTGAKLRAAKLLHLEIVVFTTIGLAEPDIDSETELLIKDLFGKLNGIIMKSQQLLQESNAGELSTE